MIVYGLIKKGLYFDSVTLMNVGRNVSEIPGVSEAAVVMGTKENKEILAASGLLADEFAETTGSDLLISIKTEDEDAAGEVFKAVETQLKNARQRTESAKDFLPGSIEGSLKVIPGSNFALISVAGRYAAKEAQKALENNLHVMLFSDNVSIDDEIFLKKLARKKGLLMMGPDCGTAIINGVPLGFANAVNRGNISIVAAAGTGLQEVSSIISNNGAGISQAIGTGGRDIKEKVGGIMFIEALKALAEDDATDVILLVSKTPDESVLNSLTKLVKTIKKPVVSAFLGARKFQKVSNLPKLWQGVTLEEAALLATVLAKGKNPEDVSAQLTKRNETIKLLAEKTAKSLKKEQKYIRGLFSGGTLCAEAQVILGETISGIYSNVPFGNIKKLPDSAKSLQHTLIDLGEDEFTIGRPHPMIDFSLRNQRILQEANDPETAVILLDVVLGYGAHPDPAGELAEAIQEASKKVVVICSITGTDNDPQNRQNVIKTLENAGAIVMESNAAACKLAGYIIS